MHVKGQRNNIDQRTEEMDGWHEKGEDCKLTAGRRRRVLPYYVGKTQRNRILLKYMISAC